MVRILSVVDAYTRECLALEADTSLGSARVTRVLERLIAERGRPENVRSDNGPEFTSRRRIGWEYNHERPHSSLDYRTPAEFRATLNLAMGYGDVESKLPFPHPHSPTAPTTAARPTSQSKTKPRKLQLSTGEKKGAGQ